MVMLGGAPNRPALRVLRATVLTGASVGTGTIAHVHAGSAVPLRPTSLIAAAMILALAWVAAAEQVRWPLIAIILGGGQALTHIALSAGGGHQVHGMHSMPAPGHHLLSAQGTIGHQHAGGPGTGSGMAILGPIDLSMLSVHVGAWLLLTVLFTIGERALWRWVRRLVPNWELPTVPAPTPRPGIPVAVWPWTTLHHVPSLGRAPPAS